jgi:hypothetical protein
MIWKFLALAAATGACGTVANESGDGGIRDAPAAVTYKGHISKTPLVTFGGGAPPPVCTYTMTLQELDIELGILPSGEVISGRVQDLNVEGLVEACMYSPNGPVIANYTLDSAKPSPGGMALTFQGEPTNLTKAALTVSLSSDNGIYAAVLSFHRTDQGPPLDWSVIVTLPLVLK